MKMFRIVGWEQYQHYKDRNPPWIKLHRELLSSRTWVSLDDSGRVLMVALMLVAAQNENKIPLDPAYLKRVAYLNTEPNLQPLFDAGFIEMIAERKKKGKAASTSASTMLAPTLADASNLHTNARPEERRGETETEGEEEADAQALPPLQLAQKVAAELCLQSRGILESIAGAISFLVKHEGKGNHEAVQFLIAQSKYEISRGNAPPNKFWFDDRKWRPPAAKSAELHEIWTEGRGEEWKPEDLEKAQAEYRRKHGNE